MDNDTENDVAASRVTEKVSMSEARSRREEKEAADKKRREEEEEQKKPKHHKIPNAVLKQDIYKEMKARADRRRKKLKVNEKVRAKMRAEKRDEEAAKRRMDQIQRKMQEQNIKKQTHQK